MKLKLNTTKFLLASFFGAVSFCAAGQSANISLSGAQEVPPVTTAATASGTITVAGDGAVSGSISTSGMEATMAHIHEAATGQNGPVIVPLSKTADNVWSVPQGAKLSAAQMQSFKDGNLYVNVHSAANKAGEIRSQLKP